MVSFRHIIVNTMHKYDDKAAAAADDNDNDDNNNNNNNNTSSSVRTDSEAAYR